MSTSGAHCVSSKPGHKIGRFMTIGISDHAGLSMVLCNGIATCRQRATIKGHRAAETPSFPAPCLPERASVGPGSDRYEASQVSKYASECVASTRWI
jgi:hypothetical protein